MINEPTTGPEQSRWERLSDVETVKATIEALKTRGVAAEYVETREDALKRLIELIPQGGEVGMASSMTLQQIGFVDLLKSGKHPWKNLREEALAEKDPSKQTALRRQMILAGYFLGSVHAVTRAGSAIVASFSGSQIAAYAQGATNVIWVVGTQKIVSSVEEGLQRMREYVLPTEDRRIKATGGRGSSIGKLLIFDRENNPARKVTLIFVNERLGF